MFIRPIWGSISFSDPTDLPGLYGWWDASDSSTLFQTNTGKTGTSAVTADGQSVANLTDKSGNLNNFYTNAGNEEPIYHTSIQNGLSILQAKNTLGPLDHLRSVSPYFVPLASDTNVTAFHVGKQPIGGVVNGRLWCNADENVSVYNALRILTDDRSGAGFPASMQLLNDANSVSGVLPAQPGTVFNQISNVMSSTSITARINGVAGTPSGPITGTGSTRNVEMFLFAGDGNGFAHALDYQLGELIIYERTLSLAEILAVEDYLKTKWATP
jgi:hypothetical protein